MLPSIRWLINPLLIHEPKIAPDKITNFPCYAAHWSHSQKKTSIFAKLKMDSKGTQDGLKLKNIKVSNKMEIFRHIGPSVHCRILHVNNAEIKRCNLLAKVKLATK